MNNTTEAATTNRRSFTLPALLTLLAFASFAPSAHAQATRTWVSGVGDDANPGSRTAPCKTFAGAISKTAAGGEIDALDPGGFGAVTVTKSITIDGNGALASILASGTNGVVINASTTDVVNLRNLSITGTATGLIGVKILAAAEVNIENCIISGFGTKGIDINCTTPCRVNVKGSIIRNCTGGAVSGVTNSILTMADCSMQASQFGLRIEGGATATIKNCVITGNTGNAVVVNTTLVTGQAMVHLDGCLLSDNSASGVVSKGATTTVRLSNNTITGNGQGITSATSGALLSYGNNQISGNTIDGAPTGSITLK